MWYEFESKVLLEPFYTVFLLQVHPPLQVGQVHPPPAGITPPQAGYTPPGRYYATLVKHFGCLICPDHFCTDLSINVLLPKSRYIPMTSLNTKQWERHCSEKCRLKCIKKKFFFKIFLIQIFL